jgi:sulfonate transport system permease protein
VSEAGATAGGRIRRLRGFSRLAGAVGRAAAALRGDPARALLPWLVPALVLVVWQIGTSVGLISSRILPTPASILVTGWGMIRSGELLHHVAVSSARAFSGFALGAAIGLGLGFLTATSRLADTLLDTTLQMVRNIPVLALVPLAILWFGIDEGSKLFLVSLSVFFPVYLNTYHGIRSVDRGLVEMAKCYGLSGAALWREVILPGALPSVLVGVRFSLGVMWMVLIVAETISATSGIGYMTMSGREFLQLDVVLLGILVYAGLGKLADVVSTLIERATLSWHEGYRS